MILSSLRFYLCRRPEWMGSVDLYFFQRHPTDSKRIGIPSEITFTEVEVSELSSARLSDSEPQLRLGGDEAQQLMDALWECGIRPTAGHGSTGQIAAIEKHLEDMRRLVFDPPSSSTAQ